MKEKIGLELRHFFVFSLLFVILCFASVQSLKAEEIVVYKSPTCGCCDDWVTHLEAEGFSVTAHNKDDMNSIKKLLGVKSHLASCHTATVAGYVIEGHVPAADIKRLLKEKPEVVGLTAPGMPRHSPGMQPVGEKPKDYTVLMFNDKGQSNVFTAY